MPGRQPENWGIPLWEAIERWTPRELWERYRKLAEYDIPLIIPGQKTLALTRCRGCTPG